MHVTDRCSAVSQGRSAKQKTHWCLGGSGSVNIGASLEVCLSYCLNSFERVTKRVIYGSSIGVSKGGY